jgi:hypothetical protein
VGQAAAAAQPRHCRRRCSPVRVRLMRGDVVVCVYTPIRADEHAHIKHMPVCLGHKTDGFRDRVVSSVCTLQMKIKCERTSPIPATRGPAAA